MYLLLLAAALTPWHLNIAVKEKGRVTWITADFANEEECAENLALLLFSVPKKGVTIVDAYCERDPHMT